MKYVDELLALLDSSVAECVSGEGSIGLVYSSGVDSTLVGVVASRHGKVTGYNVGVAGSPDAAYARDADSGLPFSLAYVEISEEDVEEALPIVAKAVGEPNPLKISVGIPFYFASKKAKSDGLTSMLCGQGPDELFGGYARYLDVLGASGYEGVEEAMRKDAAELFGSQLVFDERVAGVNGVSLRFPFMDEKFVDFALKIPIEFKLKEAETVPEYECVDDVRGLHVIRKFILREAAAKAGVPDSILNRLKKAAQYGSGAMKTIEKLARKKGAKKDASDAGRSDYVRFYIERVFEEVSLG
ncbi:MAG: asparagine synthase C-terminal domain-containing protein [Candidatus Altiarchaeota archaeon]